MTGPIDGLRVVDCSRGTVGTRATGMLADYGVDVIWVEPPGGDPCRQHYPAAYSVFCRGKRSITLDLTVTEQRDQLLELLDTADVFVESWQPGVAEKLGLSWDLLHERNPSLVGCSISGFGLDGPQRDLRGYEAIVHALIGTMGEQLGHRDGPIFQGLPFASIGAAYLAVIGILSALYRRNVDQVGRHVETSMLDGALAYHSVFWGESDASVAAVEAGNSPKAVRFGTSTVGQRFVTRSFLCSDDSYIGIHTGAVGAFGRLMKLLGLDDRIPPSETGRDMGVMLPLDQSEIVANELPDIFASKPRSYWVEALLEADVCGIEHLEPCACFDQAQPIHNEMVVEVEDPVLGRVQQVAPAAKFAGFASTTVGPAPTPGQHTEEILAELRTRVRPDTGSVPLAAGPDTRPLLDGVKILDFGAYYAGPYSSRLLADLGADVIKLEPTVGDQMRGLERCFYSAQAGKRSLAVDLKDPALVPLAEQILEWADIVHHNLRPGAAERLGLGYEHMKNTGREGVYLYAPGWGSTGPHTFRQSFAPMLSGYAGVTFEVAGQFNPPLPPVGHEDPGNGLLGAVGMLFGLLHRQQTGQGSYVENPQLNATMAHMAHIVRTTEGDVIGAGLLDPLQMGNSATERLYETADGWVCIAAFADDDLIALGTVLGIDLLGDQRFASLASRAENDYELADLISTAFADRKSAEVVTDLRRAGVAAVEPVGHNTHAFMNDPDQRRTGRVVECPHPEKGHIREIGTLIRLTDAEIPPHRLAPDLGEHTTSILAQFGYSEADISELRTRGVVR